MNQDNAADISKELIRFYSIGQEIRARNNAFELDWSEEENIQEFISENEVEFKLFISTEGNKAGRLLAYHFADQCEKGYIGWYECDESESLSQKLLEEGQAWLKLKGAKEIGGPMNGSSWGAFRFNTISDKPLFATEPYQPLYYVDQWKRFGFLDEVEYETHLVPKEISRPMKLWQVKLMAFVKGLKFNKWPRGIANDDKKLKEMHAFFHECFGENTLYKPVSFEKYKQITIKLEQILDFDHSYLVTDKKGKPVSVLISYKDVYHEMYKRGELKDKAHNTLTLYMKTIATAKTWRGKHLSRILVNFGFVQALKNGYSEVVFGTMMTQNKTAKFSKSFFEAKPLRAYCFMKKEL